MKRFASSLRFLRIALAISVALNLAVLGVIAGAAFKGPPRDDPGRNFAFGPFTGALTPGDRKHLREAFRAQAPEYRDSWRDMKADFGQALGLLRATPYDPAAFEALLARQQDRGYRMMALGQRLIASHVASLSPEDRADFADRLEEQLNRRHGPRD